MYELVILSFLMRGPMHGYLITKILNDMIGPFAKVSNGRLYPLLKKLEEDGLIGPADVESGAACHDRRQRPFQITEAGRQRFYQLMMDTASNPGDYAKIFWYKLPFMGLLSPDERTFLLEHFLNYCQTHIFHITGEMDDLKRHAVESGFMSTEDLERTLFVMRHYRNTWELELADARAWRELVATSSATLRVGAPGAARGVARAVEETTSNRMVDRHDD